MTVQDQRISLNDPHTTSKTNTSTLELDEGLPRQGRQRPRQVGPAPDVVPATDAPLHVTPCEDGWQLKIEGVETPVALYPTKKEAMTAARALAKAHGSRLVEHRADGTIRG